MMDEGKKVMFERELEGFVDAAIEHGATQNKFFELLWEKVNGNGYIENVLEKCFNNKDVPNPYSILEKNPDVGNTGLDWWTFPWDLPGKSGYYYALDYHAMEYILRNVKVKMSRLSQTGYVPYSDFLNHFYHHLLNNINGCFSFLIENSRAEESMRIVKMLFSYRNYCQVALKIEFINDNYLKNIHLILKKIDDADDELYRILTELEEIVASHFIFSLDDSTAKNINNFPEGDYKRLGRTLLRSSFQSILDKFDSSRREHAAVHAAEPTVSGREDEHAEAANNGIKIAAKNLIMNEETGEIGEVKEINNSGIVIVRNLKNHNRNRSYHRNNLNPLKKVRPGNHADLFMGKAIQNGGKRTKKKKISKKKKSVIKKVHVYRSKGGYYYRRYKNGKVKRISKEIYQKCKKK